MGWASDWVYSTITNPDTPSGKPCLFALRTRCCCLDAELFDVLVASVALICIARRCIPRTAGVALSFYFVHVRRAMFDVSFVLHICVFP